MSNSTFSSNNALRGGGINNPSGTVAVSNSTLSGNSAIGNGGGNLSFPDTTCPGRNADPLLGPLQNNGGPTETMELLSSSAAIDAGIDATCAADPVNNLDQRGVARPQGAHCDTGAVEQILEPAAVRLSAISAESAASRVSSFVVSALLLALLASIAPLLRFRPRRPQ